MDDCLLFYSRSMLSILFLHQLGELSLASGALAMGFAILTGYTVLFGLAMGMEAICFVEKNSLFSLYLQRTVLMLLFASLPIALLWLNTKRILLFMGEDDEIAQLAHSYILCLLPDLIAHSLLHPLRAYLRMLSMTLPLTYCTILSLLLHLPINYMLVSVLHVGARGVALGSVWTNFNLVFFLIIFISFSSKCRQKWGGFSIKCFNGWDSLLDRAISSCISVCLNWWSFEVIIHLCGLVDPKASIFCMGIPVQSTKHTYIFPFSLSLCVSAKGIDETIPKMVGMVGLCCSFVLRFLVVFFIVMVRKALAGMFCKCKQNILGRTHEDVEAERAEDPTGTGDMEETEEEEEEEERVVIVVGENQIQGFSF